MHALAPAIAFGVAVISGCSATADADGKITRLPDSCALVSSGTVQDLTGSVGGAPWKSDRRADRVSTCRWEGTTTHRPAPSEPARRTLAVSVFYFANDRDYGEASTVEHARNVFAMEKNTDISAYEDVPGLGDEAYLSAGDRGAQITFRYSNVSTTVTYDGAVWGKEGTESLGQATVRAGALRAAREVARTLEQLR